MQHRMPQQLPRHMQPIKRMRRIHRGRGLARWGGGYLPLVGTLLSLLGCGSDTTGPAPLDPAVLPWRVLLNVQAVTLSTAPGYDTLQLVPSVQTLRGTPVPGVVRLTYTSPDPSSVLVDSTGLLHAMGVTAQTPVTVTARVGTATVSTTVLVRVTADDPAPPRFDHMTLEGTQLALPAVPTPAGFHGLAVACTATSDFPTRFVQLQARWFTPTGELAPGTVLVAYTSSDSDVVAVSATGDLVLKCRDGRTGPVTITASTTAYGVTNSASLQLTVVPKLLAIVYAQPRITSTGVLEATFDPGTLTIGAGGIVMWRSTPNNDANSFPYLHLDSTFVMPPQQPIDVAFDAPPGPVQGVDTVDSGVTLGARIGFLFPYDPAGGNIPAFKADTVYSPFPGFTFPGVVFVVRSRARQFPVPGTYHYHSTLYGTTGTILVRPWTP